MRGLLDESSIVSILGRLTSYGFETRVIDGSLRASRL